MQLINKKHIKRTISQKKINNLDSFVIVFKNKTTVAANLTRISRTQFLNLNPRIFSNKTLPANIYFYTFNTLNDLINIKNNIILIKFKTNYFYPNQLNSLLVEQNISKLSSFLGLYKKFYFILKTISDKK